MAATILCYAVAALVGFAIAMVILVQKGNPRAEQLEHQIQEMQTHTAHLAESANEWRTHALNMERQRNDARHTADRLYQQLDRIQNVLDGHTEDQ